MIGVPHERLGAVVLAEVGSGERALRILPGRSGLTVRQLKSVLRHDGLASLVVADRILVALDRPDAWWLELADCCAEPEPELPGQLTLFEEVEA